MNKKTWVFVLFVFLLVINFDSMANEIQTVEPCLNFELVDTEENRTVCATLTNLRDAYKRLWGLATKRNRGAVLVLNRDEEIQKNQLKYLRFEYNNCLKSEYSNWCGSPP